MRILQVTDCYPPPLIGGRDLQVRMLTHELSHRGHEVEVVTLTGSPHPGTEFDGNIPVHRIAGWSRFLNHFYVNPDKPFHPTIPDPGVVREVRRLIEERKPQVVHAHSWMLCSLLPFLPSPETKLVVTMHEYGLVCPKNTFVHAGHFCEGPKFAKCVRCASDQYGTVRSVALTSGLRMMRRLLRRVNCYIAVSDSVLQAFKLLPINYDGRIEQIPPFISDDCIQQSEMPRPEFLPKSDGFIMFAGALGPHKGLDTLLQAYEGLDLDIPLVLLGLRRHDTPKIFPAGVIVHENVPHDDVIRAWKHCSVAVVPSRWPEPVGLVALEAMAAGRPVVVSSVGGLQGLVRDGVSGIHVPPGDADALGLAIQGLVDDPAERFRMGLSGQEIAADYVASRLIPKIENIYDEVVTAP